MGSFACPWLGLLSVVGRRRGANVTKSGGAGDRPLVDLARHAEGQRSVPPINLNGSGPMTVQTEIRSSPRKHNPMGRAHGSDWAQIKEQRLLPDRERAIASGEHEVLVGGPLRRW